MKVRTFSVALGILIPYAAGSALDPTLVSSVPRAQDPVQVIDGLQSKVNGGLMSQSEFGNAVRAELEAIQPAPAPSSVEQVRSTLQSIFGRKQKPRSLIDDAARLIQAGLGPSNLQDALSAYSSGPNSPTHVNRKEPSKPVFPKVEKADAPYTQTEKQLRQQIYIPPGFTYGKKQPVIMIPGTGLRGFMCFNQSIAKYIRGTEYADPVYINPPGYQLADAQLNAETVAYAVNYISGISGGRNVAMLGWSQGSISMHWAVKYWPSARKKVNTVVSYSGDYHGTFVAYPVCNPANPCAPSLIQQEYNSSFIKALRSAGGESAYVPTTNVYSGVFDEIVEPQQGTGASAFLLDKRRVGVLNAEIQTVCGVAPGGGFVDHESILYQSLTKALTIDALKHGGAPSLKRINLKEVCSHVIAPGLDLDDVVVTESLIPFAVYQVLTYPAKVFKEPRIKAYARR